MKKLFSSLVLLALLSTNAKAQNAHILSDNHSLVKIKDSKTFLLLPVEEKEENAHIKIIKNGAIVKEFNCRLSTDYVDYFVPLNIKEFGGDITLDITFAGNRRFTGSIKDFAVWKELKTSDTFDQTNREKYRPLYHQTPPYGWMNDPNGMFYKDGVWHLYFQYNPFGSQWENMNWAHSTSKDLINWNYEGVAVQPDAYGTVFSGSAVVDHNNTAGFGKGAVVGMYTSAGASQTQSLIYSTDNGATFKKYEGNPIITSNVPDFRDPHIFWSDEFNKWYVILAAGQEMEIYSSSNLKEWKHESSFGNDYGNHSGVWECPELFKLPVKKLNSAGKYVDSDQYKWVLICNINPGGPFGGSATQYFVGTFDGSKFICDTKPEVTKWMDYGKDHYATVSFDNAPNNRRVAIGWMNNWQYANQVPTMQFRSANTIARDLGLFEYNGDVYLSSVPAPEMLQLRGKKSNSLSRACELVIDFRNSATITLSNSKDEKVVLTYDAVKQTLAMDRTNSGEVKFSNSFPVVTTGPTYGKLKQLRVFIDNGSIEALDAEGKIAMTNLVFPSEPYSKISVKGKAKCIVYNYNLK